jgi:hypothetical protein
MKTINIQNFNSFKNTSCQPSEARTQSKNCQTKEEYLQGKVVSINKRNFMNDQELHQAFIRFSKD